MARLEELEQRVRRLEADLEQVHGRIDLPAPAPRPATPSTLPPPAWPAPGLARSPDLERRTFEFDTERALKWGGVGLVVLAVGFAVSTAISRGWIGPGLQLGGAVTISVALIATGLRLQSTRPAWTHALCAGGVLALFTTAASNLFIDEAGDDAAFVFTAVVGLAGYALTWRIPSEWVGAATLLGGIVGWFVIGDGEPPALTSVVAIVGVVAMGIAMALAQGWFALRFLAHGAGLIALLALADVSDRTIEHMPVVVAAILLTASLVRVPSIGDLSSAWQQLDVQLAALAGPWALGIVSISADLDSDTSVGVAAIAIAVGAAIVAFSVRPWLVPAHHVSLLIGASVTLSIGFAILLSTAVAFTALAVQGAGLVVLGRALGDSVRVLINAAVLLAVSAGFVMVAMTEAWDDDAPAGDDVAHLVIIAAVAVAAWQTGQVIVQQITSLAVLALTLVWLGSVLVHLPQGQAAVSISWAVVGTAVLVAGAVRKRADVGGVGLAVLAITVGKLLTVDLQEVDALWRAGLFLVVGLGFLRLGFLLPRLTGTDDADTQRGDVDLADRQRA